MISQINVRYMTPSESKVTQVNNMNVQEAAKFYSLIGIVSHPLNGKKPRLQNWQGLIEDGNKYQILRMLEVLLRINKKLFSVFYTDLLVLYRNHFSHLLLLCEDFGKCSQGCCKW
jgi:hypothetical protein